jgi:hypothetical protein
MEIEAVLLLGLVSIVGGALFACVQGVRALVWSFSAGANAPLLRALGLNLCEPLINLLALFSVLVTAAPVVPHVGLLPLMTTPLLALLAPAAALLFTPTAALLRDEPHRLVNMGLVAQGAARWGTLACMLYLAEPSGGWLILWFGTVWYSGFWGAQQARRLYLEDMQERNAAPLDLLR